MHEYKPVRTDAVHHRGRNYRIGEAVRGMVEIHQVEPAPERLLFEIPALRARDRECLRALIDAYQAGYQDGEHAGTVQTQNGILISLGLPPHKTKR